MLMKWQEVRNPVRSGAGSEALGTLAAGAGG